MAIKAKLGAGVWDILCCEECEQTFSTEDVEYEWSDEPETTDLTCPSCGSDRLVREERG